MGVSGADGNINHYEQQPPRVMNDLCLLDRPLLSSWCSDFDRRQRMHGEVLADPSQTLRLVHDKDGSGYNIDRYGEVLWFYRFRSSPLTAEELAAVETFCDICAVKKHVLRQMENRGETPLREADQGFEWTAQETDCRFVLRSEQGWSPGLFLDQRSNRSWVGQNSKGLKVLNLFAYTAGFSVYAARGAASEVTTVDTSKQTLNWAKANFTANDIDLQDHRFYSMDARDFLEWAKKKSLSYDLIICDPPSFARSKKSVFKIEKEFKSLLQSFSSLLNTSGKVLFCTNYEKWSEQDLQEQVPTGLVLLAAPDSAGDHEQPRQARVMKTLLLQKS